jgi:hypothetical protein
MGQFGESVTAGSGSGTSGSTSSRTRTLEIGFFFDGTLNNLANAEGRGEGSYADAPSNVALLSRLYSTATGTGDDGSERHRRPVYVEGIGTISGRPDDVVDAALGTGNTGVSARVHWACQQLARAARARDYAEIIVDAFGFSRGSAAARYFVNCVNRGSFEPVRTGFLTDDEPVPLGRVVLPSCYVRFLGIFDSVAAIGTPEDGGDPSDANNADVNVHLHDGSAEAVYHLIAGDEHRRNFALNSILDANGRPPTGGQERALPGAHSDVGGGYRGTGETLQCVRPSAGYYDTRAKAERARDRLLRDFEAFRQWAVREQYASNSEFYLGYDLLEDQGPASLASVRYSYFGAAVWRRPNIRAGLEKIALELMHAEARRHSVPFATIPSNSRYAVPSDLSSVRSTITSGGTLSREQLALVHSRYVHRSAHYGAESGSRGDVFRSPPRFSVDIDLVYPHIPAPGDRRIIHPNQPRLGW